MIATVLDNLFDTEYKTKVEKLLFNMPVTAINVANGTAYPSGSHGTHRLFGENLFERESVNTVLNWVPKCEPLYEMLSHIESTIDKEFFLERIDFNLQHSFCDGTSHIDGEPGEYTVMYMVNTEWNSKEWGGQFQLLDGGTNVIEEHEFVPGRILIFPSEIPHRGLGPRHPHVYRYTVVWRVKVLDDML